jgi:hypothetical protein
MGQMTSTVQSPQTTSGKSGGLTGAITQAADQANLNSDTFAPAGSNVQTQQGMQSPITPVQSTPPVGQSSGKGGLQGSQGAVTFPGQGGQPSMGQPNNYSNTVGSWDNSSTQPNQTRGKGSSSAGGGKSKGQ